jgi:plastocyanin
MTKYRRLLVVLAVFLLGIALLPYLSLSADRIDWQRFARAYEPDLINVDIVDFAFVPDPIVVPLGTTVRWTNVGAADHTVTSDTALFDSGVIQPGGSFQYTFNALGNYGYFCSLHPGMTGTVIVVEITSRIYLPMVSR